MKKNILILLCILCFSQITLFGQNGLTTETVSIFKDGNAFFIKKGNVKCENGIFVLKNEEIPKARFGTLWFNSANNSIESISSFTDTTKTTSGGDKLNLFATNLPELLALNQSQKVKVEINGTKLEGEIEKVESLNGIPKLFYLKNSSNIISVFDIGSITKAEFEAQPNTQLLNKTSPEISNLKIDRKIAIKFNKANEKGQNLEMMFLQKGLKWQPFYYMELLDSKKAKLTLRSEVTNNSENLANTTVNFVVGVPNFKYSKNLTNLVDFRVVEEVEEPQNNYRNSYPPPSEDYSSAEVVVVASPSFNNQLTGENVEDFYFYPLKNFSLPKGGRGHYQFFSEEVTFENIYECDIVNLYDYSHSRQTNQNQSKNPNKVFHGLKISNKSKNPFTNAPVVIVDKQNENTRPLAQDMLQYTPIGGSSNIKVTESPDIELHQNEIILNRDDEKFDFFGHYFYKANVEGKIVIKNYKNKTVKLEVRQNIEGTLGVTQQEWQILSQKVQPFSPNSLNHVQWNFELKAGQEKVFTYQFEVYVDR